METEETIYLSKSGMKDLKKDIARIEQEVKQSILELRKLDKADIRDEQFERVERILQIDGLRAELQDKQLKLKQSKPLPRKRNALQVAIGSVVELLDQQGRIFRYTIVDSFEADPSRGLLSVKSPLGQSLLGKKVKQTIEWSTNKFSSNRMQLVNVA